MTYARRALMSALLAVLLSSSARAAADEPAEPLVNVVTRTLAIRWARDPPDGTWVAGLAFELVGRRASLRCAGDAARLRDPRPGVEAVVFAGVGLSVFLVGLYIVLTGAGIY